MTKILGQNCIFQETEAAYRSEIDFFIGVSLKEWESISRLKGLRRNNEVKKYTIKTKNWQEVLYDFSKGFHKLLSHLRRPPFVPPLQKLHLWQSQYVQSIVTDKAHRLEMRMTHANAWRTSALDYNGSGYVERGVNGNYSLCRFQSGKEYHCDLNASYNIEAKYFIREIINPCWRRRGWASGKSSRMYQEKHLHRIHLI